MRSESERFEYLAKHADVTGRPHVAPGPCRLRSRSGKRRSPLEPRQAGSEIVTGFAASPLGADRILDTRATIKTQENSTLAPPAGRKRRESTPPPLRQFFLNLTLARSWQAVSNEYFAASTPRISRLWHHARPEVRTYPPYFEYFAQNKEGGGVPANHSAKPARSLRKTRSSSTLNSAPSSRSGRFRSVFSSDIRRRHLLITS
jgi:hypothetical protein